LRRVAFHPLSCACGLTQRAARDMLARRCLQLRCRAVGQRVRERVSWWGDEQLQPARYLRHPRHLLLQCRVDWLVMRAHARRVWSGCCRTPRCRFRRLAGGLYPTRSVIALADLQPCTLPHAALTCKYQPCWGHCLRPAAAAVLTRPAGIAQVALAGGWAPAAPVLQQGLRAGVTATQAMQHLIQGSAPFPSVLPVAAQVRFARETNSLQLRVGKKAGSGVFYVWHPADEGSALQRLDSTDAPAFVDVLCTQGAIRGHFKGLLFSSAQVLLAALDAPSCFNALAPALALLLSACHTCP